MKIATAGLLAGTQTSTHTSPPVLDPTDDRNVETRSDENRLGDAWNTSACREREPPERRCTVERSYAASSGLFRIASNESAVAVTNSSISDSE